MGCIASRRVEPAAAQNSCEKSPDDVATIKQFCEEYKALKAKEKKRKRKKKKKRNTDRNSKALVEDSQYRNRNSHVHNWNFEEESSSRKDNLTVSTESSHALPSNTRLHADKESSTLKWQNKQSFEKESVLKCEKKKKKSRKIHQKKQKSNSDKAKEKNEPFKAVELKVNCLHTDDEEKPTKLKFENTARPIGIRDKLFNGNKIIPSEEKTHNNDNQVQNLEKKEKGKEIASYSSEYNKNQKDVFSRKETNYEETSNVRPTNEADKKQVDYNNVHRKETESSHQFQKKELDILRDAQYQGTTVIVYQNTTDKDKWNFSHIDRHALQAPHHVELSVETLAHYLSKPVQTTLETVRAFYVWITNNIRYDIDALESDDKGPSDPQEVLKLRTCVCAGYAKLFEALCSCADVEVKLLFGFSKGYNYTAEKTFTLEKKEDHAWNAVKINEKWFLIDCTWGAKEGIHSNENQNDFYFLPDPQHMINTHFPYMNNNILKSNEWQLIPTPVSINDFSKNVKPTYQASKWKIYPKSHKHGIIDMTAPLDITLKDTEEKLLKFKAKFLNMSNGNREENGCVFARKETTSEINITVRPRSFGKFLLQLYGETDKNTNQLTMLMEYIIKSLCIPDLRMFPQESELWGIKPEAFESGLCKGNCVPVLHRVKRETEICLQTTRNIPALVRLHSAQGNLKGDEGYVFAESTENTLILRVRVPFNDYYKLTLYLRPIVNENAQYHPMAIFMIDCIEPLVPCIPFPEKFSNTDEYNCSIIEPVYRHIPACRNIRFRMKSNILKMAYVSGKKMGKVGDEWIVDITSPGAGEAVIIMGNVSEDKKLWSLFKYETVGDSNGVMERMLSRSVKPCENIKKSFNQCIVQTKDLNTLNDNHLSKSCGLGTDIPAVDDPRTKYALQWGLKPKSHTCSTIKIEHEVEIIVEDSMDLLVFSVNLFLQSRDFLKMNEYVFLRKEPYRKVKLTIRPPSAGTYTVQLFGHIDKESKTLELLLNYTITSSPNRGLLVKPYPIHYGSWGIKPEAVTLGLHNENASTISTFYACKRKLEIFFRTKQKVYSLCKLEPASNTLLDEQHYTILESTKDYLKVKINFPFVDFYKLTLLFKMSDCQYTEVANFLIDCQEQNKLCMPFPKTFGTTQKFSCSLIEPLSGFLPAHSTVTFRIKSPIVKTFQLAGEKMERINDEYVAIVNTPSEGTEFHLSGKAEDEEQYWKLFQYEIVSKTGKRKDGTYISNIILESKEWDFMCYSQYKEVQVTEMAKELGIQPLSHKGEVINVHEFFDITILDIKNCLENCEATLSRLSNNTDIRSEYIFIRKENTKKIVVTISPPPHGLYSLNIYGHNSRDENSLPLLLKYTIKSDGVDEDRPFPTNDGLWGFLSDVNKYGFQHIGAHLVPVMYKVKGGTTLCFPTSKNIRRLVKLTFKQNLPDEAQCTLIENDNQSFNVSLRLPFTGYYKLTIFSKPDAKFQKTGSFLIDCIESANPCLPFPKTFESTQDYNCVLGEPLNGILPANSKVTCRFRSSIVSSAIAYGHKMTKEGNEWILRTTTPSSGEAFDIAGKLLDRDDYLVLFRYHIR